MQLRLTGLLRGVCSPLNGCTTEACSSLERCKAKAWGPFWGCKIKVCSSLNGCTVKACSPLSNCKTKAYSSVNDCKAKAGSSLNDCKAEVYSPFNISISKQTWPLQGMYLGFCSFDNLSIIKAHWWSHCLFWLRLQSHNCVFTPAHCDASNISLSFLASLSEMILKECMYMILCTVQ